MAKKNFRIAENDNTRLWRELQVTNPDATKEFTRGGGFKGTQIDPTWRFMRMTEYFGPVGKGWGWEQVSPPTVTHDCVFICARAWWSDGNEQHWTGPQWGGTEILRKRRDGTQEPNDEAFKMAMTDAVGKCLVQLGLAADVHLGLFDDSKYREEAAAHYREEQKPAEVPKWVSTYKEAVKLAIDVSDSPEHLNGVWNEHKAKLAEVKGLDEAAWQEIVAAFSTRKTALLNGAAMPKANGKADTNHMQG